MTVELFDHQVRGVEWLKANRHGALWDEQGLGKTLTVVAASVELRLKRVLVVCPTVVLYNWFREIVRYAPGLRVQIISKKGEDLRPDADVVVTTHGLLLDEWTIYQLTRTRWDLLVVDEMHFFRTPAAKRTQMLYQLAAEHTTALTCMAARVWCLSGTPIPNHAGELWTFLRALFPERIAAPSGLPIGYDAFLDHFCVLQHTRYGPKPIRTRNLKKLREILKPVYLRRLKKDELPNLPALRFDLLTLFSPKLTRELRSLETRVAPKVQEAFLEASAGAHDGDEATALLSLLRSNTEYATFRKLCGLAKAKLVAEQVATELEGNTVKIGLFAHHIEVIALLKTELDRLFAKQNDSSTEVLTITGQTSARARDKTVELFQKDPTVRVVICNIIAAGTGITLTAASEMIFVEMSFVPGENAQAADRFHRIGQKAAVRARFAALANSIDEDIVSILRTKTRMIREVLDP